MIFLELWQSSECQVIPGVVYVHGVVCVMPSATVQRPRDPEAQQGVNDPEARQIVKDVIPEKT